MKSLLQIFTAIVFVSGFLFGAVAVGSILADSKDITAAAPVGFVSALCFLFVIALNNLMKIVEAK